MSKLMWNESHGGLRRYGVTADGKWYATLSTSLDNVIRGYGVVTVEVATDDEIYGRTVCAVFDVPSGYESAKARAQEFVDAQYAQDAVKADPTPAPDPVSALVTEQAPPVANANPAVWPLVLDDMKARDGEGRRKYGVPLQPHNGRDTLVDLYQELLDAVVYTRTLIYERDGK